MKNRIFLAPGCPTVAEWRALLARALPVSRILEMEAHLDGCAICGTLLASLAPAPPALLREAARQNDSSDCAEEWCEQLWSTVREENPPSNFSSPDDDPSGVSEGKPLPFEQKGDYKALGRLGRGGMGVVYLARQVRIGRDVAVKVLARRIRNSPDAAAWLRAEAQRLGKLVHPNIVRVYDADEQDGVPFFSMELVKGRRLGDLAHDNPFAPRPAAALVQTIARAVQYAHDVGVIHCDLKPANILVTAELVPKITDYGLATTLDEASREMRRVAGTAEYMAPEQWIGDPSGIGLRTDVYGIGTILYELLVGRPPFAPVRQRAETRQRVLFESPVSPRKTGKRIPRDLEAICMRCLQKSPDDRYQSAAAVADDLDRFVRGHPVKARPVSRLARGVYFVRRNRPLAIGVAAVVMTLCLSTTYVWSLGRHRQLSDSRRAFETGRRAAEDGQVIKGIARMREALELLPAGEPTWRRYFQRGLAAWESRKIRSIANLTHSSVVTATAVSPQGRFIALGDATGETCLWNPTDNTVRKLALDRPRGRVGAVAFNSAGTLCASGGEDSGVAIWAVDTGEMISECRLNERRVGSLAFLGSDGRIATGTGSDSQPLRIWSVVPGSAQNIPTKVGFFGIISCLVASADGDSLVTITPEGSCWLWNARAGRPVADIARQVGSPVTAAAISPDGSTLAVAGRELALCNARSGEVRQKLNAGSWERVDGLAYRRDGGLSLVVRMGDETMIRQGTPELGTWDDISASGLGTVQIAGAAGDLLISGSDTKRISLWEVPLLSVRTIDLGGDISIARIAVSDDATRVVTLTQPKLGDDHPSKRENRAPTPEEMRQLCRSSVQVWNCRDPHAAGCNAVLPAGLVANCLALSPAGDTVAVGCNEPDPQEGQGAPVLAGSASEIGPIAFRALGTHGYDVRAVAFTADGKDVISGSVKRLGTDSAELACWNVSGGCVWKIPCRTTVCAVAVAPRGSLAAVGTDQGAVHLVTMARAELGPSRFDAGQLIAALAFSRSGRHLAVGTQSGRVIVLRLDGLRLRTEVELDHPRSLIKALAFGAGDRVLFCGIDSGDRGVICWDTGVWEQVGPVVSFTGGVHDFGVAPSAPAIVAVTFHGKLVTKRLPLSD